ncbi:hypothetical protein CEUSTIGMA_g9201.t1 [Chlamydomonas eustigma]|uniref:Uncharacterized protein n=1 Tax=Chlamydomonas eustigma TaxID=1157962 RepID=A0A250XFE0_9CHLO|nr:hypothetical protein CEUSTIGMA_g9201.t1 [Chlamydomonas eustigma]|eukprot:GAX81773.1 hypothetical protein CEUSTIGMA_g9201.t1 [Chlamydomonas eustigma]
MFMGQRSYLHRLIPTLLSGMALRKLTGSRGKKQFRAYSREFAPSRGTSQVVHGVQERETEELVKLYMESRKGRQVIVLLLRQLANQAVKREVLTSSEYAAIEFNIRDALKHASDAIIMKSQPAPYGFYLICSGFVQGCDQIASQFDDPYDMMPLDDIFGTYADDINRTEKDAKGALEAVERAFNVKESEDLGAVAKDDMTPHQPAVCCDIPVAEAPALSQHKWSTLPTYTDTVSVDNPDVQGILVPTNSGSDNQLLPSGVPTSVSLNPLVMSGQAQPVLNAVLQPIAEGGRTLNRQWKSIAQAQSEASEPPYAPPATVLNSPAVQKL